MPRVFCYQVRCLLSNILTHQTFGNRGAAAIIGYFLGASYESSASDNNEYSAVCRSPPELHRCAVFGSFVTRSLSDTLQLFGGLIFLRNLEQQQLLVWALAASWCPASIHISSRLLRQCLLTLFFQICSSVAVFRHLPKANELVSCCRNFYLFQVRSFSQDRVFLDLFSPVMSLQWHICFCTPETCTEYKRGQSSTAAAATRLMMLPVNWTHFHSVYELPSTK